MKMMIIIMNAYKDKKYARYKYLDVKVSIQPGVAHSSLSHEGSSCTITLAAPVCLTIMF
jgi:hypothetical protein